MPAWWRRATSSQAALGVASPTAAGSASSSEAAGDQPLHQQPRPVAVRPGQDHPWRADPGRGGQQAQVGFALDLLEGGRCPPARLGPRGASIRQTR